MTCVCALVVWHSDGLVDLIRGNTFRGAARTIRFYENTGTATSPLWRGGTFADVGDFDSVECVTYAQCV